MVGNLPDCVTMGQSPDGLSKAKGLPAAFIEKIQPFVENETTFRKKCCKYRTVIGTMLQGYQTGKRLDKRRHARRRTVLGKE